jgi:hypothetical protein
LSIVGSQASSQAADFLPNPPLLHGFNHLSALGSQIGAQVASFLPNTHLHLNHHPSSHRILAVHEATLLKNVLASNPLLHFNYHLSFPRILGVHEATLSRKHSGLNSH